MYSSSSSIQLEWKPTEFKAKHKLHRHVSIKLLLMSECITTERLKGLAASTTTKPEGITISMISNSTAHCVSQYPTSVELVRTNMIKTKTNKRTNKNYINLGGGIR